MTVNYTSLLSLGQPVTGTESGTWGDDVNNAVTAYLDIAVAGTLSFTGDGSVTLANTQGTSSATNIGPTTAQYHALRIVGPLSTTKVITAPSTNKSYVVINTDSTYGVTIKASGQTGVTVPASSRGFVTFDGTDYVFVGGTSPQSLTGLGTGVATALGVNVGSAGAFVVNGGALGTPASGTLTNATGLPISTGVSGLGSGVATFLATPSSANLRAAVTDETGSGSLVFATSPTLVTPALGTPASGTLTSCTGLPISSGVSGLGTNVATALGINVGTAGAFVTNGGALGTPSSGTLTNATGLPLSTGVTGTLPVANGGTGATTASTARTGLGATTVGSNFFTLTNPSAITFPRINADNTVSTLTDSQFRTAIGAGTGNGSVTSVATGTGLSGGPITTTGTISLANTTVTPAAYGSASQVATFTVDQQGRLTAAGNTNIAISGSAVSGNISGNAANVTGTVAVGNGGTGATDAGAARTNLGLGTMSTQNANSVAITGGSINGTTIGASTASTGAFTTVTASTQVVGPAGSESTPSISFSNNTNAGLYISIPDVTPPSPTNEVSVAVYGARAFTFKNDRATMASAYHQTGTITATGTTPTIASGIYTPTLTGSANVTSTVAKQCQWMRVGNVVTVSGMMEINATSGSNTTTILTISLPIASTFTAATNLAGCGSSYNVTGLPRVANIYATVSGSTAVFRVKAEFSGADDYFFTFTYLVL